MNLNEARNILEITEGATPDDAKKKFRQLSKIFHPDNKETGNEEKFKKINEAYQCIQSGKGTDREMFDVQESYNPFNPFGPFGNPFGFGSNPLEQEMSYDVSDINIKIEISFKESVLGCNKDLKFSRKSKCNECNGQGKIRINNGCDRCGGRGHITGQQGNMIFQRTCNKCGGKTSSNPCKTCSSTGILDSEISINVKIPGGIQNGNILRLGGVGNYAGSIMGTDRYANTLLYVSVIQENGLKLNGQDVESQLEISLLDALCGCKKIVNTIYGEKEIDVKPLTKNFDEIILLNLGVNKVGGQKIILNVQYPENIEELVAFLKEKSNGICNSM